MDTRTSATTEHSMAGSGYVGFLSKRGDLSQLIECVARQDPVTWTVCEDAGPGDLVVFYAAEPWYAFFAYGKVIRRIEEKWKGKPMADVGMLRLLPEPVSLQRAKNHLALPWLNAAQGFANRRQENIELVLALERAR